MSAEQNKAIARRALEEPWKGNLSVVDELTDPKYIGYDPSQPEPIRGPEGVKEFIAIYKGGFSDAQITVDDQVAEGDKVVSRWTGRGTNDGELMGMPPSGKRATVAGISIMRIANGKIIEDYTVWDTLGMLQKLGVVPELATA